MAGINLKKQILGALSNPVVPLGEKIEVLGDAANDLYVKTMTAGKMFALIEKEDALKDKKGVGITLMIESIQEHLCDKEGNLIFAPEDLPEIESLGFDLVRQISDKIAELNGLRVSREEIKEEDQKNAEKKTD